MVSEMLIIYLQTEFIVQMLMAASENISTRLDSHNHAYVIDAHTLIRILCHKKDKEASKFLKKQYQLPPSSGENFFCWMVIRILYLPISCVLTFFLLNAQYNSLPPFLLALTFF